MGTHVIAGVRALDVKSCCQVVFGVFPQFHSSNSMNRSPSFCWHDFTLLTTKIDSLPRIMSRWSNGRHMAWDKPLKGTPFLRKWSLLVAVGALTNFKVCSKVLSQGLEGTMFRGARFGKRKHTHTHFPSLLKGAGSLFLSLSQANMTWKRGDLTCLLYATYCPVLLQEIEPGKNPSWVIHPISKCLVPFSRNTAIFKIYICHFRWSPFHFALEVWSTWFTECQIPRLDMEILGESAWWSLHRKKAADTCGFLLISWSIRVSNETDISLSSLFHTPYFHSVVDAAFGLFTRWLVLMVGNVWFFCSC